MQDHNYEPPSVSKLRVLVFYSVPGPPTVSLWLHEALPGVLQARNFLVSLWLHEALPGVLQRARNLLEVTLLPLCERILRGEGLSLRCLHEAGLGLRIVDT